MVDALRMPRPLATAVALVTSVLAVNAVAPRKRREYIVLPTSPHARVLYRRSKRHSIFPELYEFARLQR